MRGIAAAVVAFVLSAGCLWAITEKEALRKFQRTFPNTRVESFRAFERIPGLFEVVTKGGRNIIYYYPDSDLVFFGEIWTVRGKSLTAERLMEIASERIKRVDTSTALKIGSGPVKLIEFTDPDCPFCRRVDEYLSSRSSRITRYVFLMPLPFHRDAREKSIYLICSKDKLKAFREVHGSRWREEFERIRPECDLDEAERILKEHMRIARDLGLRGVPVVYVRGKVVMGARMDVIRKLVEGE